MSRPEYSGLQSIQVYHYIQIWFIMQDIVLFSKDKEWKKRDKQKEYSVFLIFFMISSE